MRLLAVPCCRVLWLVAIAAFLVIGVRGTASRGGFPLKSWGRNGSTDAILEKALGRPELTDLVLEELALLPKGKPLLILAPTGRGSADLVAEIIAYLAWPRPVKLVIEPMERLAEGSLSPLSEQYGAVALCSVGAPPSYPAGRGFGEGLRLIPLSAR